MQEQQQPQEPIKDEHAAHPIADAWRPTFKEIIKAFAEGDYDLRRGLQFVAPVPSSTADQIKTYIAGYGETFTELPDETWETSIAQWIGTHWDVLVDLWTIESGGSDLALSARVFEDKGSFRIEVDSIHVP